MKISKTSLFGGTLVAAGMCAATSAQSYTGQEGLTVAQYDGNVIASSVLCEEWDLGTLRDFGVVGFDGPLGSAGNAYVPAGFFTYASLDSEYSGPGGASRGAGGTGLVGVGPSAGFGNPANAIGANFFVDSLKVDMGGEKCAFVWTGVSLLGSTTYDLYVDGAYLATLDNDVQYILSGGLFSNVSLYDPAGGAEAIYGYAATYTVPTPGALALLGLGGLAATRRRR